jgi:hypothetical protein
LPNTDTITKVESNSNIYFNGGLTCVKGEVSIVKVLSKTGTPLVAKFFISHDSGKYEEKIGKNLKEQGING